jgi:hypothetical protein
MSDSTMVMQAENNSHGKVVEAQTFLLRDEAGRVRASLGFADEGEPVLQFFDEAGNVRIEVGTRSGEPGVTLLDKNRKARAEMSLARDNRVGLHLKDRNGTTRMKLDSEVGGAQMKIYDENAKLRMDVGAVLPSDYMTRVYDSGGQKRACLAGTDHLPPCFSSATRRESRSSPSLRRRRGSA